MYGPPRSYANSIYPKTENCADRQIKLRSRERHWIIWPKQGRNRTEKLWILVYFNQFDFMKLRKVNIVCTFPYLRCFQVVWMFRRNAYAPTRWSISESSNRLGRQRPSSVVPFSSWIFAGTYGDRAGEKGRDAWSRAWLARGFLEGGAFHKRRWKRGFGLFREQICF